MKTSLLLFCFVVFSFCAWGQERVVAGKVSDKENGETLPGVNVLLKGTGTGTATDAGGVYRLKITGSEDVLVFSIVGYQSMEVSLAGRTTLDIQLVQDVTQLSEIVVTGTGVPVDRRKTAIAIESVTADKLPAVPTASIDQALIGKIAGAQFSSVDGTPGAEVQILLRGINSLQRGTQPMILVDGVQMFNTNLSTLDLSSVEKVEVVQGAAAATIYGAQGANGVIQIFTKKGKGKINIDFSTSIAVNEYLNTGGLHKAQLHGFKTDANNNVIGPSGAPITLDPTNLTYSESLIYLAIDPLTKVDKPYDANFRYHDHFKDFFQRATTTNANVRISGSSGNVDYAFTVSNNRQESNIKNGGYNDRTNFTSNVGMVLAKNLTFRTITQLAYTKNTINTNIYGAFNARPFVDFNLKDPDGNYGGNYGYTSGVNGFNPNYYTQYSSNVSNKVDLLQNFNLNYRFSKFVEVDALYGLNYQNEEQIYTASNQTANKNRAATNYYITGYFVPDYTGEIDNFSRRKVFQNFLAKTTVTTDFKKDFNLNIPLKTSTLISFDWRNNVDTYYTTSAANLPTYTPFTAAQATNFRVQPDPYTRTVPFVTYGILLNQRFDFGEVAGISAGFRSDYSSAFGRGSKPFTFPRADGYFRLSALSFWDKSALSKVLLEMKIRAAYGKAGIQPFPFDRYVTLGTKTFGANNSFYLNPAQSNPDLNVEVSTEKEVGMDMVFNVLDNTAWLNKIALSGTYWSRATENAIMDVTVAPSQGVDTQKRNAISLASHGLQISLSTRVYKSPSFTWNLTTNFTKQSSIVTSIDSNSPIIYNGEINLVPGSKVGQFYGYLGLHSVTEKGPNGESYIPIADQAKYELASNGWVVDKTTKRPYFTPDRYNFGDPNPNFNISFINDFSFKGIVSIGFQFDWISGSHIYNATKEWGYRDGIHSDYTIPFTIAGETGAWSAFYQGVYLARGNFGTKNYFYEDASFLRLRNVNVSFDLVKAFNLNFIKKLQLVLSGRNLWTITSYSGMDPELNSNVSGANSSLNRANDNNTMPNLRSYQVGINFGF